MIDSYLYIASRNVTKDPKAHLTNSQKIELRIPPHEPIVLTAIVADRGTELPTEQHVPLRVTYFSIHTNLLKTKTLHLQIDEVAKLLYVKPEKVKEFVAKKQLEQKITKLAEFLSIAKKLEISPEEVAKKYSINLPKNWKKEGGRISSKNFHRDVRIDPHGKIYIMKLYTDNCRS